jgi:hypothetical protein
MPPFRSEYVPQTLRAALAIIPIAFTLGRGEIGSAPSIGPHHLISLFTAVVGPVYPPARLQKQIHGWAAAPRVQPTVELRDRTDQKDKLTIELVSAAMLKQAPYPRRQYALRGSQIVPDTCDLVIKTADAGEITFPLEKLRSGAVMHAPGLSLFLDVFGDQGHVAWSGYGRGCKRGSAV